MVLLFQISTIGKQKKNSIHILLHKELEQNIRDFFSSNQHPVVEELHLKTHGEIRILNLELEDLIFSPITVTYVTVGRTRGKFLICLLYNKTGLILDVKEASTRHDIC